MLPNVVQSEINLRSYLRVREAARLLGVHPDTLRRWESTKKLVTFRHPINRYRLYRKEDLEAILLVVQDP